MKHLLPVGIIAGVMLCLFTVVFIVAFTHPPFHTEESNSAAEESGRGLDNCSDLPVDSDDVYWASFSPRKHVNYSQEAILSRPSESLIPVSFLPENVTILTSESLPVRKAYIPEVGNGHLATVVQSDAILMNGLYNGNDKFSHRARIPSTAGYSVNWTWPSDLERLYSLDLGRGIFTESYANNDVTVTLRTYAHRRLTRVLVNELTLSRKNVSADVSVKLALNRGPPSEDVLFDKDPFGILHGTTEEAEYPEVAPCIDFYFLTSASLEGVISISPGLLTETFVSLTSIDVNKTKVIYQYEQARASFLNGTLLSDHVKEWDRAWQRGRIDVEGDITVAKLNYACLYYLMSSLPFTPNGEEWPFFGLSPGGLAHGVARTVTSFGKITID